MKDRDAMTEGPSEADFGTTGRTVPGQPGAAPGGTGSLRAGGHHEAEPAFRSAPEREAAEHSVGATRTPNPPSTAMPGDRVVDLGSAQANVTEGERTIELREEQLIAHKDFRELGEVVIRTEIEEVPGRLEVEAQREEVEIEHVPVGQFVSEREDPWEEDGVLVVPIYEEQLVVVKRLMLREHLRIRRVRTSETHLYEDTLRRDHLIVEDPNDTGLVHEQYPDTDLESADGTDRRARHDGGRADRRTPAPRQARQEGNLLENIENAVRRVFH